MQFAKTLQGQEMVLELLSYVQESVNSLSVKIDIKCASDGKVTEEMWTSVLQLDHMRSKNKYVKTIEKWTGELHLTGRLIFIGKLILILIQGQLADIKV